MVWKAECPCKEFDFVFGVKPENTVDVICPICMEKSILAPADLVEVKKKGSDK